jgi:hypothetical protein
MRALTVIVFSAAVVITLMALSALASPAHAQTNAQWSQLIEYVRTLANREIEDRMRIEQQRQFLEQQKVYIVDFACKYNLLLQNLNSVTAQEPTGRITLIEGVACGKTDPKTDPAPTYPEVPSN